MSFSHWLTVAALALLPLAAAAQQTRPLLNPADASAPVPAPGYASVFKDYRAVPDEEASPDKIWRAANGAVQGQAEHSGHAMSSAPSSGASIPKDNTAFTTQDEPRSASPNTDPHAGHAGHHNKGK